MWSAQHYLELLLITVKLEPNQAFRSNVLLIEWLENKLNGTYKETVKQIQSVGHSVMWSLLFTS